MTVTVAASQGETCVEDPSETPPDTARLVDQAMTTAPDLGAPCRWRDELGMATAEYAIATVAAAGFAGLLLVILRSNEVRALLLGIIRGALSV